MTLDGTLIGENYIVNVYNGDTIYKQIYMIADTLKFELERVDDYNNTYTLAFVFGYYGKLTLDAGEGINTNITASGRKVTISTFADTTITYTLANPRINSTIII